MVMEHCNDCNKETKRTVGLCECKKHAHNMDYAASLLNIMQNHLPEHDIHKYADIISDIHRLNSASQNCT